MQNEAESIKYRYKAFGLNIISDFQIDELPPSNDHADVYIINGVVPDTISGSAENKYYLHSSKSEFIFSVKDCAQCYVSNGNRIIIEPVEGVHPSAIRLILLGTAMSVLLLQRGMLPMHGSAAVINGMGVIFTGSSGAGKSTLSLALQNLGYSFLTDDVAALSFQEDGKILIHPGFPQRRLWRDCAEKNGYDVSSLPRVLEDMDKYIHPIDNGFHDLAVPLKAIIEIRTDCCEQVSLHKVLGLDKLPVLIHQTYRMELLSLMSLRTEHFQRCAYVAKDVPVYRMTRPKTGFTTDTQIELILSKLQQVS